PTGKFGNYLRATFPSLDYVPIAFITALTGKNVQQVVNLAQHLHKQASARVSTGDLNRVVRDALARQAPPLRQNRRPKVYYATQVAGNPPTVVLFTNGPELFDNTYLRYLLKTFRDHLPFHEVPIKLYLRRRTREDAAPADETRPRRADRTQTPEREPPKAKPKPEPRKEKKRRERPADLVEGLPFRTTVSDEELEREAPHYESELWKDL